MTRGLRSFGRFLSLVALVASGSVARADSAEERELREPPEAARKCAEGSTASISAAPTKLKLGETATLTWSVTVPRNCSGFKFLLEGLFAQEGVTFHASGKFSSKPVGANGTMQVQPPGTSTYAIVAYIPGGPGVSNAGVNAQGEHVRLRQLRPVRRLRLRRRRSRRPVPADRRQLVALELRQDALGLAERGRRTARQARAR